MKLKKSFAIEAELFKDLQRFTKEHRFKSEAYALNYILSSVLLLPADLCKRISEVCAFEYKRLNDIEIGSDELYAGRVVANDMNKILEFKKLMDCYASIDADYKEYSKLVLGGSLRRSELARGYGFALYPREWVVLNESEASRSKYAYVFEARNADKYNVPHFIYFSNVCYYDIPDRDAECDRMDELIKAYSDDCAKAFNSQVAERYELDSEGNTIWVNREEWDESFVPAHFNLPIKGSTLPFCDQEFPFGAHIERPSGYDFERDNRYVK